MLYTRAAAGGALDPGHGLPSPHAPPQLTRTRESEINNQPAWNPRAHTFPSPNVKHHLGQKRQATGGTRHV
jgi:hypothetical protein